MSREMSRENRTKVNLDRLERSLHQTGEIGRTPNGGITRTGFSPEYRQAANELKRMMEEAGLTVTTDRVGNLFGRREGKNPKAPAIMTGSHLDTVIEGGLYDGNLGIISALEAIRMMNENRIETNHPIELAAFNAEEGSEMGGTFGSRVMTGRQDPNEKQLEEKLDHYNLTLQDVQESVRDMKAVGAFVELHIEQGGFLEQEQLDIGIVDGIVGITRYEIHIKGESNHAGTTPMKLRKDPVLAASVLISKIWETSLSYGPPFVATVGKIEVNPGMYNVIPSDVTLFLELRDLDQSRVVQFAEEIKDLGAAEPTLAPYEIEWELQVNKPSKMLSRLVMDAVSDACDAEPDVTAAVMASGAGHDAKELIYCVPTGMIFVPSIGGISHSPKEYTTRGQMEKGVQILYQTLLLLDQRLETENR